MSRRRTLFVAVAVPLAVSVPLLADEPKAKSDTPEAVARKAMTAMKENRLDDFAKAMHPDALKTVKSTLVTIAEAAAKDGREREVTAIFGDKSLDELKKLDDAQFFAAFYGAMTRRRPELKRVVADSEVQIIGHVMEGRDTAHVVLRMTATVEGTKIVKTDVVSMKKTSTGWGMLLSADLENMASVLKKRYGVEKK
jgi:hypothetical protein